MGWAGIAGTGALLGALGGALYLAVLTGSPGALILVYLAQLPLFAAGLWLGIGAVTAAALTASAVLLAAGGLIAAALFAGLYAAPVVLLVRQALLARNGPEGAVEWYPPGLLTAWLTGLGLAAFAAALLFFGGPSSMESMLRESLAPAVDRFVDANQASRDALIDGVARVVPGVIAASWMVMTASTATLAQGILARFGASWRPSPDLAALTLPLWVSVVLGVAAGSCVDRRGIAIFGHQRDDRSGDPVLPRGLGGAAHCGAPPAAAAGAARRFLCAGRFVRLAVVGDSCRRAARRLVRTAAAFRAALINRRKRGDD